jgi:uncharacterized protein YjiS (DUF1127 family)
MPPDRTHAVTNRETALVPPAVSAPGKAILHLLRLWIVRRRTRRALSRLDTARLADIGVSADAARAEAAKPFWRG